MKKVLLVLLFVTVMFVGIGCDVANTTSQQDGLASEFRHLQKVVVLSEGDEFFPYADVIAYDPVDGDISDQIVIEGLNDLGLDDENRVTEEGEYLLLYKVTNSRDVEITETVTVVVDGVMDDTGLDYELVWSDEFNYTGLPDEEKWTYDVGGHGWGNGESQYYTEADPDNAYVSDGTLTITAIQEHYENREYTSTRLLSHNEGSWLYGKFEISAKLPEGVGVWPAIWMLPTNWEYGGWPDSGEIDIMEFVGYEPNRIHYTIHTEAYNHMRGTQIGDSAIYDDVSNTFHEYQLEWLPDKLIWYIDDVEVFRYSVPEGAPEDSTTWPFDIEFHLIMNIAVGGAWGGQQGIDNDIWPQSMEIDYVRVYQADSLSQE